MNQQRNPYRFIAIYFTDECRYPNKAQLCSISRVTITLHIRPSSSSPLFELRHEVLMELDQPIRPLRARCKERRPEMQRALLLSEP